MQGQDGWILAKFSSCVFMDLNYVKDKVEVHKNASRQQNQIPQKEKKNKANIQPVLTLQLVNKGFIIWHKEPKKNDLRTYLFSTTEKEASYKQK